MSPLQFEDLSLSMQSCFLWSEGKYICSQKLENHIVKLFLINGFYVEVYIAMPRKEVDDIVVLGYRGDIQPYLDQIKLPDYLLYG